MNNYEIMLVVKPMSEENLNTIIDKAKSIITVNGKVNGMDNFGEKRLAFEINGFNTAIYILLSYNSTPKETQELDKYMRCNEDILRHMIVNKN